MDVGRVQWRAVVKCVAELPGSIETLNLLSAKQLSAVEERVRRMKRDRRKNSKRRPS
jgi:hypothetical protein